MNARNQALSKTERERLYTLVTNPAHTGIGPYQPSITVDQWIAAQFVRENMHGRQRILKEIAQELVRAFEEPPTLLPSRGMSGSGEK